MSSIDLSWYLVYTKPQKERLAKENLERQGYDIYLPFLQKRIKRGRQFHYRTEPLFPRYLFIRLSDRIDDWSPVRSTTGVTQLVRFGELPLAVPESLLSMLQERENNEGLHELTEREPEEGDRVRFVDSSLSGYEAIFHSSNSSERVTVLMDIAGQYSKISVNRHTIEILKE